MPENYKFDPETGSFFSTQGPVTTLTSTRAEEIALVEEIDDLDEELIGSDGPDALFPPDTFSVLSQTVRTNSDGSTVVDVIIEVDDDEETQEYEVRLTK